MQSLSNTTRHYFSGVEQQTEIEPELRVPRMSCSYLCLRGSGGVNIGTAIGVYMCFIQGFL